MSSSSIPIFNSQRRELETLALDKNIYASSLFFNVNESPEGLEKIFSSKTKIRSILVYPMILISKMIGYLVLSENASTPLFTVPDIKNVSIFAVQIPQSIRNTKFYEKLEVKVTELKCALTGSDKEKKKFVPYLFYVF